jgi:hypothetical protein
LITHWVASAFCNTTITVPDVLWQEIDHPHRAELHRADLRQEVVAEIAVVLPPGLGRRTRSFVAGPVPVDLGRVGLGQRGCPAADQGVMFGAERHT